MSILRDYEDTKDGRGVYLKLLDIYECKSNMEQVALMALSKLQNLRWNYNTTGGVPVFIGQFRDTLNDLKDAKQPMSDVMAKSMFLGQIQDRDYTAIVDTLMDASVNFEGCMQRILDKYNMLANFLRTTKRQTLLIKTMERTRRT